MFGGSRLGVTLGHMALAVVVFFVVEVGRVGGRVLGIAGGNIGSVEVEVVVEAGCSALLGCGGLVLVGRV